MKIKNKIWALIFTSILIYSFTTLGESAPPNLSAYEGYQFEMHWGFIDRLSASTADPTKLMRMDGIVTITDGDENTKEGIHLISALLFESGGLYEYGEDDFVEKRKDNWAKREFDPWIRWRSSTTDDWDGIAVAFWYQKGTNPIVKIETTQWSIEVPINQLKRMNQVLDIGDQGQKLEIGKFFTLSYKVYDMRMEWGYNKTLDLNPDGPAIFVSWDGSLSISEGGIRFLRTIGFDNGRPSNYRTGTNDYIYEREDLSSIIQWRSSTLDNLKKGREIDGIALNFVVPKGATPIVKISFKQWGDIEGQLPPKFKDVHIEKELDDEGHFIHIHLHWCWYKVP